MPHHTLADKLREIREKIAAAVQAHEAFTHELKDIEQLVGVCENPQATNTEE